MRGRRARLESRASVIFIKVSTMLSWGPRESRDNVSRLSIGLNRVVLGWKIRTIGVELIATAEAVSLGSS